MSDFHGKIVRKDPATRGTLVIINQESASTCTDAADFTSDENYANMILSNVTLNVSEISFSDNRYGNIKYKKKKQVDSEKLSERWNIDPGKAKKNVTQTVQHGFRRCLHPTLGRQYLTNDWMLHYESMPDPIYSDTLKSGIVSK